MTAATIAQSDTHIVRGACPHDCPDTCATLTTVENGRATRIAGDPDHPFTSGFLCAKVNRYLERTYHRDRLLYPMRRVGRKGSGSFVRVSWDEAIGEIAVGIGLALLYWVSISVFAALGGGGLLAPTLAAWAPNLLFGAGALYLLLTVRT